MSAECLVSRAKKCNEINDLARSARSRGALCQIGAWKPYKRYIRYIRFSLAKLMLDGHQWPSYTAARVSDLSGAAALALRGGGGHQKVESPPWWNTRALWVAPAHVSGRPADRWAILGPAIAQQQPPPDPAPQAPLHVDQDLSWFPAGGVQA